MDASITKRGRNEHGVAAVEFALVIILLLIIVAGIIEFGRAFWYLNALTKATRDGARFMSEVPTATLGSSVTAAEDLVADAANAANVPDFDVDEHVRVKCDDDECVNNTAPEVVRVEITGYQVTIGGWIPIFLPTGGVTSFTSELAPSTTMRYMQQEPGDE